MVWEVIGYLLFILDYLNNVNFRFNKKKRIFIKNNKIKKKIILNYYASYKKIKKISDGYKIGNIAEKKSIYRSVKLGRGEIFFCDYKKLFFLSGNYKKKSVYNFSIISKIRFNYVNYKTFII